MVMTLQQLGEIALLTLNDEERRRSAVYIDPQVYRAGSTIAAGRQRIQVPAPAVLVFVDLAPASNWGHPCRYLLLIADNGTVASIDGQFPPPRESLRLLHRGPEIKDWMLLTQET